MTRGAAIRELQADGKNVMIVGGDIFKEVKEMTIKERVEALRELMIEHGIDAFLVPTDDFHGSEYVGEYFKTRKYMTGFTGSAGTALILAGRYASGEEYPAAGLWTDGRYFLQAESELEGSGIELFRMAEPEVPKIEDFLADVLDAGACIGWDGRTISVETEEKIVEAAKKRGKCFAAMSIDLVGRLWTERPSLSCEPAEPYDVKYAGMSRADKLAELKKAVTAKGADMLILTALDDIAWLLNIRGGDVACNPVVLSYFVLDEGKPILFIQSGAKAAVEDALTADGVELREYNGIYEYVRTHSGGKTVIADKSCINSEILGSIDDTAKLVDERNYKLIGKAVKNPTEVENMVYAHLKDGVAKTKWIYWLKQSIGKEHITEITAAEKLHSLRTEQENSRGDSFDPIMGYEAHGAIIHYSATQESASVLEPKGFLLADTGGQYLEGTTDVTRTVALGPLTDKQKQYYTAVLRGHLKLQGSKFAYGAKGSELDPPARAPLAELGLEYNHGTGHGVGVYLNVHEDPVRITHAKVLGEKDIVFEEGMIVSDEPGIYPAGEFGVRIENLLVCLKDEMKDGVQMMKFEPLTLVPYEREAVEPAQMTAEEKALYNEYQSLVCEKLSPHLAPEEAAWLAEATRAI